MLRVARRAEELGYTSLWTFQRLLHPAAGDWGPMYHSVQDPLVTLAYVAAVTSQIRLGVAIVNVPFYSPIALAKPLSTLDIVSGGRLDAGLGLGWAREEFAAAGVPYERRGARGEDFIRCLQAIWGDNPVSYDGEFYSVPPSLVDPKPVQRPHPPILLGGTANPALQRAGRYADGWVSSSRHDLTQVGEAVTVIKAAADSAGRDADDLRFVVRGVVDLVADGSAAADRRPLTGSADQIRGDLESLAAQGITDLFFDPNFDPRIGSPAADPAEATDRAEVLLETLAPVAP
jgi:probable F420-dependent oxidoreductase